MVTSPQRLSSHSSILQPSYSRLPLNHEPSFASGHQRSSSASSDITLFPSSSWTRPPSLASKAEPTQSVTITVSAERSPSSAKRHLAVSETVTAHMSSVDLTKPAHERMEEAESPASDHSDEPQAAYDGETSVNISQDERPRVRAEGPGGSDIKRGARIACLECRSAKIRCSAPNDGQVPCKRCARHDKECVFEKHRRGRKPGRGNLPKYGVPGRQGGHPTDLHRNPSEQNFADMQSQNYLGAGQWSPPLPTSQSLPHMSSPGNYPGTYASSSDYFSRPLAFGGDQSSRNTPGHPMRDGPLTDSSAARRYHGAHPGPLPHFPRQGEFSEGQVFRPALRSPYDAAAVLPALPQHGPSSSSAASTSRQHGFFSPPLPRAEASSPQGHSGFTPLPPGKDERYSARWGPTFGSSSRQSAANRGPPESPRTVEQEYPLQPSYTHQSAAMDPPTSMKSAGKGVGSSSATSANAPTSRPNLPLAGNASSPRVRVEVEEEEEDELVDEDDVGGAHQDASNILSRPLQLLAYASTAAARRQAQGGYKDARSVAAAASLGLIPTSPSKLKKSPSPLKPTVNLSGGGQEPATLENGNWEYKAGRVRAIKAADASESPASQSKGSEESAPESGQVEGAIDAEVLADTGPHLGKRRRSDDEPLPQPKSRRQSELKSQIKKGLAVKIPEAEAPATAAADTSVDTTSDQVAVAAGASRKGYFRFSLYSSKLDVDDADDPINASVATLKEMEDLFDVYFNQINPINVIFDPFLHSLSYVRARSKFLLTVIASQAARMSPGDRNAELAEKLEKHWRTTLLPKILLGGYKSVEISQAFLLASQFHRPTHIIVEDRAWQYLGFAIRTATEIGVNIALAPNARDQEDEQMARRLRNRERLWLSLVIAEGILSTQFGRPCTLSIRGAVSQSTQWNREDYALPEDAALVCQIELRKIVESCSDAFDKSASGECGHNPAKSASGVEHEQDRSQGLIKAYKNAWQELERWRKTWSPAEGADHMGIGGSMAMSAFLVRWSPYSRLIYYYWRCHVNSIVLQLAGPRQDLASPVAYDSFLCARQLLDTLLDGRQFGHSRLALAPNAVVVMATYAAVSAMRLAKLDHSRHALVDQRGIFEQVQRLADALEDAGRTPSHRDGAAGPYGLYLRSVLALFDGDSKSSSSVASEIHRGSGAAEETSVDSLAHGAVADIPVAGDDDGQSTSPTGLATALAETADALFSGAAAAAQTTPLTPALNALSGATTAVSGTGGANAGEGEMSGVYASDSEVWEYLANAPAGASLWPSTTWNGL